MSRAESHAELVERAARWLRNTVGCSFVATALGRPEFNRMARQSWKMAKEERRLRPSRKGVGGE